MLVSQAESRRKRILYVDDNPDHRELISSILTACDYQTSCARNGGEALRLIRELGVPDLVLTDYQMPILDGAELLKTLKKAHPGLPVVIQSGMASLSDAAEFMRMGADDVVPLPIGPDELVAVIERILAASSDEHRALQRAPRPRLFIGSSSEGVTIAEAIRRQLDPVAEVTLWPQGVFGPGSSFLDALMSQVSALDFAALLLTPDDAVTRQRKHASAPRDNVLLELGICLGRLGRERTFAVIDRSAALKLPSELLGYTLLSYAPHERGNLCAALRQACWAMKEQMARLGRVDGARRGPPKLALMK